MRTAGSGKIVRLGRVALGLAVIAAWSASGCTQRDRKEAVVPMQPTVVVIAPVLNLSGSQDFDPLRITDLIASELQSFDGIAVVPVNLALAELQRRGLTGVETAEDARALGAALGADATLVVAVTEYDPFSPPVVGMVMQWYAGPRRASARDVGRGTEGGLSERAGTGPQWQVQRVYNAADQRVQAGLQRYAQRRDGGRSPYAWRKFLHSQELYVRYCGWATIQTMLLLEESRRDTREPVEAQS